MLARLVAGAAASTCGLNFVRDRSTSQPPPERSFDAMAPRVETSDELPAVTNPYTTVQPRPRNDGFKTRPSGGRPRTAVSLSARSATQHANNPDAPLPEVAATYIAPPQQPPSGRMSPRSRRPVSSQHDRRPSHEDTELLLSKANPLLLEQLQMMQAERDAALRHAASLQQSLNAALADAGACRRGLASTQQLLLQREAELKRLRGEGGRLSSPRSAGMSRRNSFQQRPHSAQRRCSSRRAPRWTAGSTAARRRR